jgi:ABC-2 type transport system permease protein
MMLRLLRTELVKQLRRPRTWVAIVFVVAVPIIITVALKTNPPDLVGPRGGGGGGGDGGPQFFRLAPFSGLVVPAAALRVMSNFFLVVIFCMFAGDAIAAESGWGNLRFLLTRPIGRGRLLAAKFVVAGLLAALVTLLVSVSGLLAGGIAFGFKGVDVPLVGVHQSAGQLIAHLVLATVLAGWGIAGIAAFAFMLSTMTDNASGAIFGAVGFYIVTSILGAIDSIGPMRYGFPTYYGGSWSELFLGGRFTGDMWRDLLLQVPYVLVFLGIAFWWFRRRDITS